LTPVVMFFVRLLKTFVRLALHIHTQAEHWMYIGYLCKSYLLNMRYTFVMKTSYFLTLRLPLYKPDL